MNLSMRTSLIINNKVSGKRLFIAKVGFFAFLLSGTFYVTDLFKALQKPALIIGIALIYIASLVGERRTAKKDFNRALFLVFAFSILLSFIFHPELSILVSFFGLALIYFASKLMVDVFLSQDNYAGFKSILDIFILFQVAFLFVSFIARRPNFVYGYEGLFSNPNGLGGFCSLLFSISLGNFLLNVSSNHKKKRLFSLFYIFSIFVAVLFLLLSRSRTAIITTAICAFVGFFCYLFSNKFTASKLLKTICFIAFLLVVLFILFQTPVFKNAFENFVSKIELSEAKEDVTSGRSAIWKLIFSRLSFFGNGEISQLSAHNTFFSMLDQYGFLAFILLCFIVITGIVKSLMYIKYEFQSQVRFIPIMVFLNFTIESLTESMMLKTVMLLMVICLMVTSSISKRYSSSRETICRSR